MISKLLNLDKNELFSLAENKMITAESISKKDIAIIGMSGRFGAAENLSEYWEHIKNGNDLITSLSEDRKSDCEYFAHSFSKKKGDTEYLKGAFLDEIDKFDNEFFNISLREAKLMDPNQRLFLEKAWEAIEDAGYCGKRIAGSKTGVYIGYSCSKPTYETLLWESEASLAPESLSGNVNSMLASRIAYILDLKGPCILVDTACSSSLMAVHLACMAIRNGECDMAIAGGVKIMLVPIKADDSENIGIASSDGKARTFDDNSDGTGIGEGVAAILLKPLEQALNDKDHIYAVIKGSAANNDGSSIGITAPNSLAQRDVIIKAWEDSGINPETVSYIEAHGTGTKLGDPIEIDGIQRAFKKYTNKKQFCAIGSIKTNIGHLDNMAGMAGLIKGVLSIYHGQVPPSLHFDRPNRRIKFEDSPVYVNDCLNKWEADEFPRRCGISSFGISGTNCHVVLEEAPLNSKKLGKSEGKLNVLALSAKSETSLNNLLIQFAEYLRKNKGTEIEDICFTQNTGRMHYSQRLCLILKSRQDLDEKISLLIGKQFANIKEQGMFYGAHKIVRHHEGIKDDGYISEIEKRELSRAGASKLDEFFSSGYNDREILEDLCTFYTKGADIDWDYLYKSERKVSLPTYQFDKKRCWIDMPVKKYLKEKISESDYVRNRSIHQLLGQPLYDTINQEVFTAVMSIENQWLLSEHKVGGNYMLVGTAYLEIAMQASQKYFPDKAINIRELTLLTPLILSKEDRVEVHTVIMKEDGFLKFIIASKSLESENTWIEHAQGKVFGIEKSEDKYELTEVLQRCNYEWDVENKHWDTIVEVGKRWKCLKKAYSGTDEVLGFLELSEEFYDDFNEFQIHPPMLDTALNFAGGQAEKEGVYFPFYFDSVKIYSPLPTKFISYVRIRNISEKTIEYNITLVDEDGRILMSVDQYVTKKESGRLLKESDFLHTIEWVEHFKTEQEETFRPENNIKSILVFNDKSMICYDIINRLKSDGVKVIEVNTDEEFCVIYENKYSVGQSEEDYYKLLSYVNIEDITSIIFSNVNSGMIETLDLALLENKLENGVYSLFRLAKAILHKKPNHDIKINLLSQYANNVTNTEECLNPENAALFGLAFVLAKEYANLKIKCMDIDQGCDAGTIISEFRNIHETRMVAFRNGRRYIERLKKVNQNQETSNSVEIRENGVYIITGGLGGIGLEIAKHMATSRKINLVLVSRSKMPERNEWEDILRKGEDNELCHKISTISYIESLGSHVIFYNGNVSDMENMRLIIDSVVKKYGKIDGVIHSAGIAGNGLVITKDENKFKEVMEAKVHGTWIIDYLTNRLHMDFLILFSSADTLTTSAGQSDYTSANFYMDTYSYYRNKKNKLTICINWAAWKETGMAKKHNASRDGVFMALSTVNAVKSFDELLKSGQKKVIVGQLNYKFLADLKDALPVNLSNEINALLVKNKKSGNYDNVAENVMNSKLDITLTGKKNGRYTSTELRLGKVWGTVFLLKKINVYESFYDQGGDSIFAMKITNLISRDWGMDISITDIMNNQSIFELGQYIDSELAQTKQISLKNTSISKVEKSAYYPVSSSQKRLYILEQYGNIGTTYNIPVALKVEGKFDRKRAEAVIDKIIKRHESLRTTFMEMNGNIVQVVNDQFKPDFKYFEADEKELENIIKSFIKPFNLKQGPLVRTLLVKFSSDRYLLLMDFHHIVTDWASSDIIIKEFIEFYRNNDLPEPKIQYKDYAVWQNRLFTTKEFFNQENYWLNAFSGDIPVLQLPVDNKDFDDSSSDFTGNSISFKLGMDLTERLNKFSQKQGVTLFMLLLASYNILLSKYTGQEDIVIGSPISGRIHTDVENTVGMFVNMLPIRNFPSRNKTFIEFLEEVKDNCLRAFENQDYPFEMIINKLEAQKNCRINSLFTVSFALMAREEEDIHVDDFTLMPVDIPVTTSKFDLTIDAVKIQEDIAIDFRYRTKLFKSESMENFIKYYKKLLEIVISKPEIKIEDIDFSEAKETSISAIDNLGLLNEIDFEF